MKKNIPWMWKTQLGRLRLGAGHEKAKKNWKYKETQWKKNKKSIAWIWKTKLGRLRLKALKMRWNWLEKSFGSVSIGC